jgi:dihydropyrimidinase
MSTEIKGLDKSVWEAMPNAPLMEHHLPGVLTEGVVRRNVSVDKIVDVMTRRPAEIFGIYPQKGSLMPGTDADLVVVDLESRHEVDKDRIRSTSSFSLFEGKELTGWPTVVIKGGKIVVSDGEWENDPADCRVLSAL